MRPFIFEIGSTSISSFFFMIMIAALAATYVAVKIAKKDGLSEVAVLDMAIIGVVASMIGCRLFHVFFEAPLYYWEKPIRIFYFWQGGFVSLGAFISSAISWTVYLKIKKLDTLRYLDLGALIAPIIIFFVRVGCLLTGCCYGKPTDFFFSLTFTNPDSTAYLYYPGIPLHATQAYNMINAVIMFGVLFFVYKRRKFSGQVGAVFLIYYAIARFFIEFLRGDADRGLYFGGTISTGQIVMAGTFIIGITMYWILSRKKKREQKGLK